MVGPRDTANKSREPENEGPGRRPESPEIDRLVWSGLGGPAGRRGSSLGRRSGCNYAARGEMDPVQSSTTRRIQARTRGNEKAEFSRTRYYELRNETIRKTDAQEISFTFFLWELFSDYYYFFFFFFLAATDFLQGCARLRPSDGTQAVEMLPTDQESTTGASPVSWSGRSRPPSQTLSVTKFRLLVRDSVLSASPCPCLFSLSPSRCRETVNETLSLRR